METTRPSGTSTELPSGLNRVGSSKTLGRPRNSLPVATDQNSDGLPMTEYFTRVPSRLIVRTPQLLRCVLQLRTCLLVVKSQMQSSPSPVTATTCDSSALNDTASANVDSGPRV